MNEPEERTEKLQAGEESRGDEEAPRGPVTSPRENPEVDEEKLRLSMEEMERVSGN